MLMRPIEHPAVSDKEEEWKDINGYEGFYQISNLGRVKSLERKIFTSNGKRMTRKERILKPFKNTKGYLQVRFWLGNHDESFKVHRLVALMFLDDYEADKQINHINGIKIDNNVENLEVVNQMENMGHRATTLNKKPRGVRKHHNRWKAQTTVKGDVYSFGYFSTKEEAYKAFFEGFKKLRGCDPWDLKEYPTH